MFDLNRWRRERYGWWWDREKLDMPLAPVDIAWQKRVEAQDRPRELVKRISQKMRVEVYSRVRNRCEDCGHLLAKYRHRLKWGRVHHVDRDPGNNRPWNLVLLCHRCHHGRHHPGSDPAPWGQK